MSSEPPEVPAAKPRRARLAAAAVLVAWIVGSMVLLFALRGVPLRVRGLMIIGSLVVLIAGIGWMKLARAFR